MKIRITDDFKGKLASQVEFISKDKPKAARKFIYKGYTIVYRIKEKEKIIEVFGITKFEKNPFD